MPTVLQGVRTSAATTDQGQDIVDGEKHDVSSELLRGSLKILVDVRLRRELGSVNPKKRNIFRNMKTVSARRPAYGERWVMHVGEMVSLEPSLLLTARLLGLPYRIFVVSSGAHGNPAVQ